MKRSSFLFPLLTERSVLLLLTAMLQSRPTIFSSLLPLAPASHTHWVVIFISPEQLPKSVLLPAWLLWLCVLLFSSLFIQCMWMLNKPLWISSIYSLLEHHHPLWNLSGQTAWLHRFQSGIVSTCCLPGFITIVFLFGWLFTGRRRQRQSCLHPQELAASVPKAR